MSKSMYSRKDQVVISGMSGRFPESDSTDEFAHNLYQNRDLITEDDRRWPTSESKFKIYTYWIRLISMHDSNNIFE